MATLLAIVSALAPILLKLLQAFAAGNEVVHEVEVQGRVADAAVNAGSAIDALDTGKF